ncbi:coiled-coil domain-containing protein [Gracilibacillus massiliensis]|uniref:hypothetical protein n=1 Tax=Gracilibacillus massiliensis TaxID=1564956 RepID=UPI00071DA166|nr:hypothetical protein [Gracilibacillus massiliensis]
MIIKRILVVLTISILLLSTVPVAAASDEVEKDEVVYTTLQPDGAQQQMYVVNSFEVDETSDITDYGNYTTVKNLTDLSEIKKVDDEVSFSTSEETFYYQGDLEGKALPWEFDISYQLDGTVVTPDEMVGEDGHLKIEIETSINEDVNPIFVENYLLQIALTVEAEKYQEIVAEEGTIANAGKNKQITFTVMPDQEKNLVMEADVTDLELEAIEITGIPSSMSIESPDVDEMTEDFQSLTDATEEIDNGVGELKNGITDLNSGMNELRNGSNEYKNGIVELNNGSSDLINGSASINEALASINSSLDQELDAGDFSELQDGLDQVADGLKEVEKGLTNLNDNYTKAYQALDESMNAIPTYEITEEDIENVAGKLEEDQDREVVQKLAETFKASQQAKGTYDAVKEAFEAVSPTLKEVSGSQIEMAKSLETMASEIAAASEEMNIEESMAELQEGLATLSTNYQSFHGGLVEYTNGVGELSQAYQDFHQGVVGISDGTSELENGASELNEGTSELAESTSDMPDQMQDEIDEMINEYDKSDFDAESFVSDKNENVQSVQFVIKTEAITKQEQEEEEEEIQEEKGFWDKILDLFR